MVIELERDMHYSLLEEDLNVSSSDKILLELS
ncbi:hypothetical protein A2U01_0057382 [Trifolium medium]|uniref:Uncharacterized protein n=1 Tax=Trifolium medium TaxID=97028 RepID=A0A392RK58_9FABA|nr:hypothetical protein [Trifolium medium]